MQLQALLDDVEVRAVLGAPAEVRSVTHRSRAVAPGALFCCIPGSVTDGHQFAAAAVEGGASALLVDHQLDLDVTQVVVDDVRVAMGRAAATLHGNPSRDLDIVGITGTNGKTTVAWLLRSVLEAAGRRSEYIGTLSSGGGAGSSGPSEPPTTPDAPELQAMLARMRDDGVQAVAMEVSSHALAQSRVEGTTFAVGVFTNLTRDHLDFHATMEEYFAAKARLFEPGRTAVGVVNADDPRGRLLLDAARIPTRSYSLGDLDDDGRWHGRELSVPLAGRFNLSNALAVAATALALGIDEDAIVRGIASAPQVPGRMERIEAGQSFEVIVDYAHTPDGIENVLAAAHELVNGRVIIVLGAGGDKDREKRPLMGEAAGRLADLVVLTSDNPRSEDPDLIIAAIRQGVDGDAEVLVEVDRRGAIALAFAHAKAGDIVVIAGKGHESTQEVGARTVPFDDRVVARELLAK